MQEIAGWIAPVATMIAAMMTAANLGSRVTGWGFVVFTVGAIGWVIVALASGQQNLLISNGFLLLVDLVGVWRWLGRKARYDAGANLAVERSAAGPTSTLIALSRIEGLTVRGADGAPIGTTVEAMAACDSGTIAYVVVRDGGMAGVGEQLHALGWREVMIHDDGVETRLTSDALTRRPALDPTCWPATAAEAGIG